MSKHPSLLAPLRARVAPALIVDVEAVMLPAGLFLAAFAAKAIYLDLLMALPLSSSSILAVAALASLFFALFNHAFRVSPSAIIQSGNGQWTELLASVTLTFLVLVTFFYLLKVSDAFSRGWLMSWYALSIVIVLLARLAIWAWVENLRAEKRLVQRIAVYGHVDLAGRVLDKLRADVTQAETAVYSDDDAASQFGKGPRVLGGMQQLIEDAQTEAFDRVIVALPTSDDNGILTAAAALQVLPVEVQLSPAAMTLPPHFIAAGDNHDGLLLLDIQQRPFRRRGALIKGTMDFAIASLSLVVALPIMLIIAAAIAIDSRGPVFFVQRRHGYNHRIVHVTKFRTMTVTQDGADVPQAVRGDMRVTRVGRFLRKSSLDELPQLFDVLRGDMSLVGPRPHALSHNEHYGRILERYSIRHKVKPGITGWAQVNGWRGETADQTAMQRRLDCDLYYIENWSVWLDLRILARTLLVPFNDPNAF